ncbi:MAG: nitroreductase family protein [Eggerthellaceae bacterium]|nr:nitroreductase family protein [Eggerthellaceae bacterium]
MNDPIFERTSVRKYTDEPVDREQLQQLLFAGMAAPSAGNQQPWEFFVAMDADMKQKLSECSPYAHCAAEAAAVIAVCQREEGLRFEPCATQDMSACVENILLEATTLGLGAVWLGIAPEEDRVQKVAAVIGDECASLHPFALVAVGHPAEEFEPRSTKRMDQSRIHWI